MALSCKNIYVFISYSKVIKCGHLKTSERAQLPLGWVREGGLSPTKRVAHTKGIPIAVCGVVISHCQRCPWSWPIVTQGRNATLCMSVGEWQ